MTYTVCIYSVLNNTCNLLYIVYVLCSQFYIAYLYSALYSICALFYNTCHTISATDINLNIQYDCNFTQSVLDFNGPLTIGSQILSSF